MAYKFQLGNYIASGSLFQKGGDIALSNQNDMSHDTVRLSSKTYAGGFAAGQIRLQASGATTIALDAGQSDSDAERGLKLYAHAGAGPGAIALAQVGSQGGTGSLTVSNAEGKLVELKGDNSGGTFELGFNSEDHTTALRASVINSNAQQFGALNTFVSGAGGNKGLVRISAIANAWDNGTASGSIALLDQSTSTPLWYTERQHDYAESVWKKGSVSGLLLSVADGGGYISIKDGVEGNPVLQHQSMINSGKASGQIILSVSGSGYSNKTAVEISAQSNESGSILIKHADRGGGNALSMTAQGASFATLGIRNATNEVVNLRSDAGDGAGKLYLYDTSAAEKFYADGSTGNVSGSGTLKIGGTSNLKGDVFSEGSYKSQKAGDANHYVLVDAGSGLTSMVVKGFNAGNEIFGLSANSFGGKFVLGEDNGDQAALIYCASGVNQFKLAEGDQENFIISARGTGGCDVKMTDGTLSHTVDIAEFGVLENAVKGTGVANKAVVLDAAKHVGGITALSASFLTASSGLIVEGAAVKFNALAALDENTIDAADGITFVDANDSDTLKKITLTNYADFLAGSGIVATDGVLSAISSPMAVTKQADADFTLVEGLNVITASALTANRTATLPALSGFGVGDQVVVKCTHVGNGPMYTLTVTCDASDRIDDNTSSVGIISSFGTITLVKVDGTRWSLV